jgi:hypothetical protein
MKREVLTSPIEGARVREELAFLIGYFRSLGHVDCELTYMTFDSQGLAPAG